ncbi:MAG: hypothetical protein IT584_00760, partial [Chlamydiae bacterium]|nr:hypothetical protein [Chlamydiota bacterium]
MAAASNDLITQFHLWADVHRKSLLQTADAESKPSEGAETIQGDVFCEDIRVAASVAGRTSVYEVATLVQALAVFPLSVIAPFEELYRCASGTISFSTGMSHIFILPKHVFFAVLEMIALVGRSLKNVWTGAEAGTGFFVWHSGEWATRQITRCPSSVLSQVPADRSFVYASVGSPVLALGGIFVPSASVQVMALTILSLRIYEIASYSLGMRDCPAYYPAYSAIKTNHLFVKPLVARIYEALTAGKIAALFFAAVYTLPYSSEKLTLPWTASLIAGCAFTAFAVAQAVSMRKKQFLEKTLSDYGALIGMEWTDKLLKETWLATREAREERILEKRRSLQARPLEAFNAECGRLAKILEDASDGC